MGTCAERSIFIDAFRSSLACRGVVSKNAVNLLNVLLRYPFTRPLSTDREAYQYAIEAVVAPGDGRANMEDPSAKPLPLKEKIEIYRRLMLRDEL